MAEETQMHIEEMADDEKLEDDASWGGEEDKIGVDIDITTDGGLKKRILVKGSGWEKPETGDTVEVHYVGTLESDGSEFDSSRGRGEPFSFKIGVGQVIKGWDQGVATMKKGEKAILICRGDYAYGAAGSPPKIPPNATLHFEVELLSWKSDKDISPASNGGIIKTIAQAGEGWQTPDGRDEVLVRYTAKVEGADKPFAESPEAGTEFVVDAGHLVPALPIAVKTMKQGEKAQVIVQPEYAFGEAGNPPDVPPNATVRLDVELLSWKKVENVTTDGLVVKKTLVDVKNAYKRPNEGANVTVNLTGRLADGTVFEKEEGKTFETDADQVPSGLDLAVMKMVEGERAQVTVAPQYAYGDKGHAGPLATVPPGETVTYEVELVSTVNAKESWQLTTEEEKLAAAVAAKEKGNAAYKAGNNKRAIKLYEKASKFVEEDKAKPPSEANKAQIKDVRRSSLLNKAAAELRAGLHKDAAKSCTKVLDSDSENIKALYRRAQAYMGTYDFVEAELDIKRGLQVDPANADLLALQKKLKADMRAYNQKEKGMFSKMFAPSKASAGAAAAAPAANGHSTPAPTAEPGANGQAEPAPEANGGAEPMAEDAPAATA